MPSRLRHTAFGALVLVLLGCSVPGTAPPVATRRSTATPGATATRTTPASPSANPAPAPRAIPPMPPGLGKITHFVFIMQENRSFDSYFGTYPGADGLPPGVCLPTPLHAPCMAPFHAPGDLDYNGPHNIDNAIADIDGGRMDGFVLQAYLSQGGIPGGPGQVAPIRCPPPEEIGCRPGQDPLDVMGWHDYRDIPNYWDHARLYVLQDLMFGSVDSFTVPNRIYVLAAQSGGPSAPGKRGPPRSPSP